MGLLPKRRIKNPATQQEIDTTNRNALKIGSYLGATLIPFPVKLLSKVVGPALATSVRKFGDSIRFTKGMTTSGVSSAVKKAGSIGNTKKPDTVGNRLKQAQAIMGLDKKTISLLSGDKVRTFKGQDYFLERGARLAQGPAGIFTIGKTARTVKKAVDQGPVKFFSSGTSAKTGIEYGKRDRSASSVIAGKSLINKYFDPSKFSSKVIKALNNKNLPKDVQQKNEKIKSLFGNKLLKQSVEDANKKAREALKKK